MSETPPYQAHRMNAESVSPPLSLYVHIPWCLRKCPYCDFNSYPLRGQLDEAGYVGALLADLDYDLPDAGGRALTSIFLGGGTPSLFGAAPVARLIAGIRGRSPCQPDMEVTLEANPGSVETGRFTAFREAGVNRLSIGVQSFDADLLKRIGRVHGRREAIAAAREATAAGFGNFNLDLMYGLPGQGLAQARADLETAIGLGPSHISYYQLTLEPNTRFHLAPPPLPDEDLVWEMELQAQTFLARAGYHRYEVSAYAQTGGQCRHNLNYWRFGDYLAIGAGAHGKLSRVGRTLSVKRQWKVRDPQTYLRTAGTPEAVHGRRELTDEDLIAEFMLNALRLDAGFSPLLFEKRTGLELQCLVAGLAEATERGMIERKRDLIRPTSLGRQYLNDLIGFFVPRASHPAC